MVSKVAVIALVAIVACPILIGYAMNLSQTTENDYEGSGEAINVTPLLNNGVTYSFAHGDIYRMNTKFGSYGGTGYPMIPTYEKTITQKSSYSLSKAVYYNQAWNGASQPLNNHYFYEQFDYNPQTTNVQIQVYGYQSGTEIMKNTFTYVHSFYYEAASSYRFAVTRYDGSVDHITAGAQSSTEAYTRIVLTTLSGVVDVVMLEQNNGTSSYADLSAGWHFNNTPTYSPGSGELWTTVELPNYTKEYTLTVNLNSITASNYTMHLNIAPYSVTSVYPYTCYSMALSKTTVGGVPVWTLTNENDSSAEVTELYYDASRTNTYQFTLTTGSIYDESDGNYYINTHIKAAYIGDWPTLIGIANPYIVYELDYAIRDVPGLVYAAAPSEDVLYWQSLYLNVDNNDRTPTMRVDDSLFRAFEYDMIENQTYDPATFKQNPETTITNIQIYGSSIAFGGNTYKVTNGKITLNSHQLEVKDLKFCSVPVDSGYENRIGNTVISTTANPSTITFNGSWSASVSTRSMIEVTYTKTEWTPGQFGWDGIDQNFLMVGLITCLGVFIGLGIYIRRSRTSIWPLLIVCAGAVTLIICML